MKENVSGCFFLNTV